MTQTDSRTNLAIIGAHWGDEGKGKIVDIVSDDFDVVARYQGGHNAGHTIRIGDRQFILHLIPSGIFHPTMRCVIGSGVVLDPEALVTECDSLTAAGGSIEGRLLVSTRCHLILPYHRTVEAAMEASLGERRIGTTSRGIGPAYEDKMSRRGLRVSDLLRTETLGDRIREQVAQKNTLLGAIATSTGTEATRIDAEPIVEAYLGYARRLAPLAADTTTLLNTWIREGQRILFEGAQATLLDVDHGTFPYVTSSNSTACGIPAGLGIAPRHVHSVLGVMKAYATRVGTGPFPTEANGSVGDRLRELGSEFGATTGRPRRCGWFDGPAARYAVMINAMDAVVVTKIDVLDTFDEIPFCTGYRYRGSLLEGFPADSEILEEVEPVYKSLRGWKESINGLKEWADLPQAARDYLKFLSDYLECPIRMVSTGAERQETIHLP
jgi:adenylosuccinate synthase